MLLNYSAFFTNNSYKSFSVFILHDQLKNVVMANTTTNVGNIYSNVLVMITSDHRGKRETNVGDGGEKSALEMEGSQEGKIATQRAKKA